ncbi:MAG TPA: protein kinase [Thermoanaerobaculia bacterium]|nr:protein kinase [Thermoanaerobaculia bacterium]
MIAAGTRLGSYEILAPLGAGGMGEVYRARDTKLDRDVAIKVLPAAFANDAAALARFEREAKAVAALSHPNILAVHDFGRSGDTTYAVMELLEGESLRERLAEGPLPQRKAVEIAREAALGLAAAHDKGIVHRDLKPENLFLTREGRLKILDFGLARQIALPAAGDTHSPTAAQISQPGAVLGTVGYMAPEQLRGHPADHRSDIFSLGAVLYEMLSGRRAFTGDTAIEAMNAILKDEPPELSASGPSIAPALERIVSHCLEKKPDERFQSGRDLAFGLASLSSATPESGAVRVPAGGSRWRRRLAVGAAAAAALTLAFFAGERLVSAHAAARPLSFRRLTFRRGNLLSARFAPDGKTVVYSAAWEGRPAELFSVRTDSVESRPLGIEHADVMSVSSQGEVAIKLRKGSFQHADVSGTLARVPLGGGAAREIAEDVLAAAWTPGGDDLAVIRLTPDGKSRIEWPIGHSVYESFFVGAALVFSPSGDRLAFVEGSAGPDKAIWTVDRQGRRQLVSQGDRNLSDRLAWSRRTGEILFIASRASEGPALRSVSLSGRERALWYAPPGFTLHDVAADGRVLLERYVVRRGVAWMAPGATQEKDLGWLDGTNLTKLSPDEKWILFDEIGDAHSPRNGVFIRPTDGGPAIRLGDGTPTDFSPDGKWVLAITAATPPGLVLLPTGPGSPKEVPTPGLNPLLAFMLPDGKTLTVLSSSPGQPFDAYTLDIDGGTPKRLDLPGINWDAHGAVGPDGKLAAWSRTDRHIVIEREGGPVREIPGALLPPDEYITVFSADGRFLETQTSSDVPARIFRIDVQTGAKTLWKEIEPADRSGVIGIDEVRFNRDETGYAYTYGRMESSDLYVVEGLN